MSAISDNAANALLDVMFGRLANPFPTTQYIALSSTLPTNTGANVTEPTEPSYARASVTNNAVSWPSAAARSKNNGVEIVFDMATTDWGGPYGYFAIYSAATAGTFYGWGTIDVPVSVVAGDIVTFAVGDLTISAPGA